MKRRPEEDRQAAALAYNFGDYAPKVVARGRGAAADAIISLAHENGVYVHESSELLSLLLNVRQDEFIPPELYRAVAELLAWLYWLEQGSPAAVAGGEPEGSHG